MEARKNIRQQQAVTAYQVVGVEVKTLTRLRRRISFMASRLQRRIKFYGINVEDNNKKGGKISPTDKGCVACVTEASSYEDEMGKY